MLTSVYSAALIGIDAYRVHVEVDISFGMQIFQITGLPDGAVRESRLRIPTALTNAGYAFPLERLTINLAPAHIRKDGTAFDLAMALGILLSSGICSSPPDMSRYIILGELGLDGSVRPIRGALSAAIMARDLGCEAIFLPADNAPEASIVDGIHVHPVSHIRQLVRHILGKEHIPPLSPLPFEPSPPDEMLDFIDVCGQESVKRALEVAAAGNHNILLVGPPGCGKSMLARRIPSILPSMTFDEALETTKIYSVTGLLPSHGLLQQRPFRHPHHTISDVGLAGGGSNIPKPGELSLAHHGVLFLDEFPEFKKSTLEVMRQPLEDGVVTITRSLMTLTYPSDVMLIAAMNPCSCGYFGSTNPNHSCSCSLDQIQRYRSKLSGPLLDRLDIQIEVPSIPYASLRSTSQNEPSSQIRSRVLRARQTQLERFQNTNIYSNAQMNPSQLRSYCSICENGHALLSKVVDKLGMSARAYARILKVARTIADLEHSPQIQTPHLSEAIHYRAFDRKLQQHHRAA